MTTFQTEPIQLTIDQFMAFEPDINSLNDIEELKKAPPIAANEEIKTAEFYWNDRLATRWENGIRTYEIEFIGREELFETLQLYTVIINDKIAAIVDRGEWIIDRLENIYLNAKFR